MASPACHETDLTFTVSGLHPGGSVFLDASELAGVAGRCGGDGMRGLLVRGEVLRGGAHRGVVHQVWERRVWVLPGSGWPNCCRRRWWVHCSRSSVLVSAARHGCLIAFLVPLNPVLTFSDY